jgi:acetyl esterase/lipase
MDTNGLKYIAKGELLMCKHGIRFRFMEVVLTVVCLIALSAWSEDSKKPVPMTHTYKTVGDLKIQLDIYLPADHSKPVPAIVYLHSGALILNSREEINPKQLNLLLEAGYAVIAVDYRLAPETKLPEIISDMKDAFKWIRKEGPVMFNLNPDRIGVWGRSAGSYLTLMSGICIEPKPKALVSFFGYGDLVGEWYTKPDTYYSSMTHVTKEETGISSDGPAVTGRGSKNENAGTFYLYCRQNGVWPLEVGGHDPIKEKDFFIPYCPLYNITENYPPTMLLHGDLDNDVPYEQSVMMAKELEKKKVEHELVTITGGGHGFDEDMEKPEIREAFIKAVKFFDKHLK